MEKKRGILGVVLSGGKIQIGGSVLLIPNQFKALSEMASLDTCDFPSAAFMA